MEELTALKRCMEEELPDGWEELPGIPLYMDQVVSYLAGQMISFEAGEGLTPAMINNYIKDGLVERARGKKYEQEHLAALTAVGVLKQVLSVRELKVRMEIGGELGDTREQYEYFRQSLSQALKDTAGQLEADLPQSDLPKLVLSLALRSYASALACRRVLAVMAEQSGHKELLEQGKKKRAK